MVNVRRCELLGGTFAILIQFLLAFISVGTLIIKRQYEHPRRDWMVWFLDVLKQGVGSGVGHFANIYLSQIIAFTILDADECQWYCFTYIVDCTAGLVINIFLIRVFERLVDCYPNACRALKFGDYGDPPQLSVFVIQLVIWVAMVVVNKVILLSLMLHVLAPINTFLTYFFLRIQEEPELELVLVMVLVPAAMNTLLFWVTDTFLKRHFPDHPHMPLKTRDFDEDIIEVEPIRLRPSSRPSSSVLSTHSEALRWLFRYSGLQFLWTNLLGAPRSSTRPSPVKESRASSPLNHHGEGSSDGRRGQRTSSSVEMSLLRRCNSGDIPFCDLHPIHSDDA